VYLPFGFLFLSTPPEEYLPIPFFRTDAATKTNINVYDTIISMQQRQDWLKNYLKDNNYEPISFVSKYKNNENISDILSDIRDTLGLEENWASSFNTNEKALEHITKKVEESGIIVTFNSIVGNNTKRPIRVDECRGFVLVDEIAPFMFINSADSKSAQLFTIVHELAHIWTGHSAGFDFRILQQVNDSIEILCDKIAAEFLVPEHLFNNFWEGLQNITNTARYFKVSEIVIARRALDTAKISKDQFLDFYDNYINHDFSRKGKKKGGDFYSTTRKRLSFSFANHINNAVKSGQLLYRDAYKLTNLKGSTFQKFFTEHFKTS
jgi:Zn-dependent peptidase ImmA (M78 family)